MALKRLTNYEFFGVTGELCGDLRPRIAAHPPIAWNLTNLDIAHEIFSRRWIVEVDPLLIRLRQLVASVQATSRSVAASSTSLEAGLGDLRRMSDGISATQVLRAREGKTGTARTPVVALSANCGLPERSACAAAGMDDFLPKPLRSDALVDVLRRFSPTAPGDA